MSRNNLTVPTDEEIMGLAEEVRSAAFNALTELQDTISGDGEYGNSLDMRDTFEETVSWIPDRFRHFLWPYPWDFTEKLDAADEIAAMLGTSLEEGDFVDGQVVANIDSAILGMSEWEGRLTENFLSNYLEPMSSHIAKNQGNLTLVLHDSLQAMRDIYVEGRVSLMDIGKNAVTALDNANGATANVADIKAVLSVISGAFGIAAVALGSTAAGAAANVAAVAVASSFAIAGEYLPEDSEPLPLEADYPEDVLTKISDALDQLESDIAAKEDELIKVISDGVQEVNTIALDGVYDTMVVMIEGGAAPGTILVPPVPELTTTALDNRDELTKGILQLNTN